MEVTEEKIVWLNPEHPNYKRWQKGREFAKERAIVVSKIIAPHKCCNELNILDVGSGEGGTSAYFAERNNVISYDLSLIRLKRQQSLDQKFEIINGSAELLPFHDSSFDLIILQDVIEHITEKDFLVNELKRVLKKNGLIYISTPNKFSLFNIISDPHWGIPFLSLFGRASIKKYFLRFFRKDDLQREDIAGLLSLKQVYILFKDYELKLNTKEIIGFLSEDYSGILWSNFHQGLYRIIKKTGIILLLNRIANNNAGIVNNFFTPTFYIILRQMKD